MYQITSDDIFVRNLLLLMTLCALIWFIASLLNLWHRRAYNLTRVESTRSDDIRPDFLRVDKDQRAAAIQAGTAALNNAGATGQISETETLVPGGQRVNSLIIRVSRLMALLSAIASFVAAALTTLATVPNMDATAQRYSSMGSLMANIRLYPVGFSIAAIIVASQLVQLFFRFSGTQRR